MRKKPLALVTTIALVGLLISACGTPASQGIKPNYTNPAWGLSMWYPADWTYEEDEDGHGVVFAPSQQAIAQDKPETGASMGVVYAECGWGPGTEGVCALLVMQFAETDPGRVEISDPQPRAIGGWDGCEITFEDRLEEVRGFLAGTVSEGCLYLFLGRSAFDEWPEHRPDLEAMLDSVQFTAPVRPTPAQTG